jgi:hypothetical protein
LAQAGAFLIFGLKDELPPEIKEGKITIKGDKKTDLLTGLNLMGINESTMFPEIDKTAQYIKATRSKR